MTLDRGLGGPIAILDTNVLYSASLRHLLIWLAVTEAFDARWTETIQDEWTRSLLENRGEFDPARMRKHAERFTTRRFQDEFFGFVNDLLAQRQPVRKAA